MGGGAGFLKLIVSTDTQTFSTIFAFQKSLLFIFQIKILTKKAGKRNNKVNKKEGRKGEPVRGGGRMKRKIHLMDLKNRKKREKKTKNNSKTQSFTQFYAAALPSFLYMLNTPSLI